MLTNVHLQNLALIKEADIDFGSGLNILTGETGAGKSVIIGSINMALGDKANKSIIRTGSDSALVELTFLYKDDQKISDRLKELDIPSDSGTIIITRKLTKESSSCRINGRAVTLNDLREITSMLVDIHGQHDSTLLLDPGRHLEIVDEFGSQSITPLKVQFHDNYVLYKSLRSKFREFSQNPEELAKEQSYLEYCIQEIEDAQLKPGEDAVLEAEYKDLSNAGRITESLRKINTDLMDDPASCINRISDAVKEMTALCSVRPELKNFLDSLMDLDSLSRDLGHDISHYIDEHRFNSARFEELHQRLDLINTLKNKYGHTLQEITDFSENCRNRLSALKSYMDNKSRLQSQMEKIRSDINRQAAALSDCRKETAARLEVLIQENLQDLNFLDARFSIDFTKADKIYEYGFDKAQFMFSANTGEPLKPLSKVASGGELSRIMLAIKASIADADNTQTLIFDEIDSGISGFTAQKVGEKLALLSHTHQLICITHLPQIAAMADIHFSIEKSVFDGNTLSGIRKLSVDDSVNELARLLSGSEITAASLRSAAEMKAAASDLK